jgi:hypothetical protein
MAMENMPPTGSETRAEYWRRTLRPLFWWGILVLVLFAVHQHQLAMERTRLYCSVTMYETNTVYDAVGTLDGHQISSGDKISLGSHQFTITEPKAESFTTNFFAWYGRHDFGKINLKRGMGTLNVTAEPAAKVIAITGPEFSLTLSNSTGTNLLVPTDTYHVSSQFARWSAARDYQVTAGNSTPCIFAPQLGAISVTCNETPAAFELQDANDRVVERGDVPAVVSDLPSGRYLAVVTYHNHMLKQEITVSAKETHDVPFQFMFGAVVLETVPPDAAVYNGNGNNLGVTPLLLPELPPGPAEFRLQLNRYEDAAVSVAVTADITNTVSTNLVSLRYLGALRDARRYLAAGNYTEAVQATSQALDAKPDDTAALALQTEANGHLNVERQRADVERQRQEQLKRPRMSFDALCGLNPDAALFGEHEMKTSKPANEVETAIVQALQVAPFSFQIISDRMPEPETYQVTAKQTFSLGMLGGNERDCLLVVGQTKEGETQILFKIVEYQIQHTLVNFQDEKRSIPLHPSRMQMNDILQTHVQEGVRIVTERIQGAVNSVP